MYRPAAIKQLETLAKDVGVEFFPSDISQKPVDIANAAISAADTVLGALGKLQAQINALQAGRFFAAFAVVLHHAIISVTALVAVSPLWVQAGVMLLCAWGTWRWWRASVRTPLAGGLG